MRDDARREARESFAAGDFDRSRRASLTGLEISADDLELLRLAGKSGVEIAADDAVAMLQKVVTLDPSDAGGWHDLGEALAAEGRLREAADAFGRAVELNPDDADALIDHGHSAQAAGQLGDAVASLERAAGLRPGEPGTLRSLVDVYRAAGRPQDALRAAERLSEADPDDVRALLLVAELSLDQDRLDEALAAYDQMRTADDDEPEHEIFALLGMLRVEVRRENWAAARDLAEEALKVDASNRTEGVLGYLTAQAAGPRPDYAGRAEVERLLADSHAEHVRLHAEEMAVL
jgi:tetratricopeptide (TPR) repeat protein